MRRCEGAGGAEQGKERGGAEGGGGGGGLARLRRALARVMLGVIGGGYLGVLFVSLYRPDPSDGMGGVETVLTWLSLMGTTFLPHAGMGLVAVLAACLLVRARRAALAGAPLLALSLGPWVWSFAPAGEVAGAARRDGEPLLVLSANLLASTRSDEALLAQIAEHRPHVILVQEVREGAAARLREALGGEYAFFAAAREDNFGQAVLSRVPFTREPEALSLGDADALPQMMAWVEFGGRELCVWNIHLMSPIDLSRTAEQAAMAWRMGAELEGLAGTPVIVGGDFNGVWRSQPLDAVRARGFREAQRVAGEGPGATWPRITALRFAPGIRLDHIAFSGELQCVEAWTGEDTGSDHRPVFARMAWSR